MADLRLRQAKVQSIDVKSGNTNGRDWTLYRYKISTPEGDRWFSSWDKFGVEVNDTVDITYIEKPNPKNPNYPFLNLKSMTVVEEQGEKIVIDEKSQAELVQEPVAGEEAVVTEERVVDNAQAVEGQRVGTMDKPATTTLETPTVPEKAISQGSSVNIPEQAKQAPTKSKAVDRGDLYDL